MIKGWQEGRIDLRQSETPLLAVMQNYVAEGVIPFHTPGHKQGKGMHPLLGGVLGIPALALDLALMEEMDDFMEPYGCIKEAQELAAELYGAEQSFFLINGTTGGIYAMIMATVGPGETIIVPRNAHRSIIGGIILSGARPVFILPEVDRELGLAMGVTAETVEAAIAANPEAKAVLLINPTYYGVASDLEKIIEVVHAHGMAALVDEAHGPHLKFSNRLPQQALDAGADVCVQSTHKLIGALTQSSILHWRAGRVEISRLKHMLQLVQSTSPNYLMLASLDVARMQMATQGKELLARALELSEWLRREINKIPGLYSFGAEKIGQPGIFAFDPTKVTVSLRGIGLSGAEAERILRHEYKIQAELSDADNILFLITLGDGEAEVRALAAALRALAAGRVGEKKLQSIPAQVPEQPELPESVFSPRDAVFAAARTVPFQEAEGMICAEIINFYPPGIPVLCPGERISRKAIEYCGALCSAGMHLSGAEDKTLQTVKVIAGAGE